MNQPNAPSVILSGGSGLSETALAQPDNQDQRKTASDLSKGLEAFQKRVFAILDQITINNQQIVHNLQSQLNRTLETSIKSITTEISRFSTQIISTERYSKPSMLQNIIGKQFNPPKHSPHPTKKQTNLHSSLQQDKENLDSLKADLQLIKHQCLQAKQTELGIDSTHIASFIEDLIHRTIQRDEQRICERFKKKSEGRVDVLMELEKQNNVVKQSCKRYQGELQSLKEENRKKREENQQNDLIQREKLRRQYQNEVLDLKAKCNQIEVQLQKVQRQKINLHKFVSNAQRTHPHAFTFILQQIETFSKRQLLGSELVFQSDQYCQDLSNYLKEPFPAAIIFYTPQETIFGCYTTHITTGQEEEGSQAFLFNANHQKVFVGNRSEKKHWINPTSFKDNMLVMGNRELVLKNQAMTLVRVFCGSIFGEQCFQVKRRQELTGSAEEQVPLKRVQLHRIMFYQEKP